MTLAINAGTLTDNGVISAVVGGPWSLTPVAGTLIVPSSKFPTVKYSQLYKTGDADIMATIKRLTTPSWLLMDRSGIFEVIDFAQYRSPNFGLAIFHTMLAGMFGTSLTKDDVIVRMKQRSSTVTDVPANGSGQTNGYFLARMMHWAQITWQGTDQGHLYQGVLHYGYINSNDGGDQAKYDSTMPLRANGRISGIPGAPPNVPPNETTALSDYHINGTAAKPVIGSQNVEVTGIRDSDGALVGGSPKEWNYSSFIVDNDLNCHDTLASMPTYDYCTDMTTNRLISKNCGNSSNANGINHEESTRVTHNDAQLFPKAGLAQISVNGDNADSVVTLNRPQYSGTLMWNKWGPTYGSNPNSVSGANIHAYDASGKAIPITQVSQ